MSKLPRDKTALEILRHKVESGELNSTNGSGSREVRRLLNQVVGQSLLPKALELITEKLYSEDPIQQKQGMDYLLAMLPYSMPKLQAIAVKGEVQETKSLTIQLKRPEDDETTTD